MIYNIYKIYVGDDLAKIEDLVVIIPAYEPPQEFVEYAREVAGFAEKVIVVNDGSSAEYNNVFEPISNIDNVHYISYAENQGKGYALKTAFQYAVDNLPEDKILVTADCDGQHTTKDILKVFKACNGHKNALVLGSRNFEQPNVPKRSKFGNKRRRGVENKCCVGGEC